MEGLLPMNQTAQFVTHDLAYHDYEGVALDHEERPRLQRDLGNKNHMLPVDDGCAATMNIIYGAAALGLGTCWLGGSFTRSSFARKIGANKQALIPAVVYDEDWHIRRERPHAGERPCILHKSA